MDRDIIDYIQAHVSEIKMGKDWVTVCVRRNDRTDECFRFLHVTFIEAVRKVMHRERMIEMGD